MVARTISCGRRHSRSTQPHIVVPWPSVYTLSIKVLALDAGRGGWDGSDLGCGGEIEFEDWVDKTADSHKFNCLQLLTSFLLPGIMGVAVWMPYENQISVCLFYLLRISGSSSRKL